MSGLALRRTAVVSRAMRAAVIRLVSIAAVGAGRSATAAIRQPVQHAPSQSLSLLLPEDGAIASTALWQIGAEISPPPPKACAALKAAARPDNTIA